MCTENSIKMSVIAFRNAFLNIGFKYNKPSSDLQLKAFV